MTRRSLLSTLAGFGVSILTLFGYKPSKPLPGPLKTAPQYGMRITKHADGTVTAIKFPYLNVKQFPELLKASTT